MRPFHRMQWRRGAKAGFALLLSAALGACGGASDPTVAVQEMGKRLLGVFRASVETPLTPITASASSSERGDLGPGAAIDHDPATRWGSGFTDDEYLMLDFGESQQVTRVRIEWENAHAIDYLLQVSDDGQHWTTIKSVERSPGGVENLTGLEGNGRYLRMKGLKRSTQYGYSIIEIQAFTGSPPAENAPEPTPVPVDPSKPSVSIKPTAATSSAVEQEGLSAAKAVDGRLDTRWASTAEDGAWIQFDFGAKTQIGYLKLVWENAYARQYRLLVSDDGQQWTTLREVASGKGGTEEFFNFNVNARYLRLQGVARATQYGYSLFEAEFRTPGSDNTLPAHMTSALPFPDDGSSMQPLSAYSEPIDTLQFSLADGTLVTRFGVRALARHGRERGEEWNEAGYGPNETIDPANGLTQDKGPGLYLNFVAQYFKNRTWGMEIIDNSRVVGVTRPTLVVNRYNSVDFLPGQTAFFRAFDRPGVTGYGWMAPGELADRSVPLCKPSAYPAPGKLVSASGVHDACTLTIREYPAYAELGADGFPNGRSVSARSLAQGDVIEVAPSMFSTREAMTGKGDDGGIRYYAQEWVYVMGKGLRPWYGIQPRLNSAPLPDDTLSGGLGSVSYNYSDEAAFIFQQAHNHTGMQNIQRFVEGRRLVHTDFITGLHNEPGNDQYAPAVALQGARFNQSACISCHVNNGRSPAPAAIGQRLDTMSVRVASLDATGSQVPHPQYGAVVQMNGAAAGSAQDWGTSVRVAGFDIHQVKLADGTSVELRRPHLGFDGPVPDVATLRAAQPMIGVGLLEAVPEAMILAGVRAAPDIDGVKGKANYVYDPDSGAVRLGRFGWKASKATLRHQVAAALMADMAVASPQYPNRSCHFDPAGCARAPAQKGVSEAELQLIANYLALVAVPAQRSQSSGFPKGVASLPEHDVQPQQIALGARVFQGMRCTACHTAEFKTGPGHLFAELRNQNIRPYSDLLLHDMGPGLADKYTEGQATGSMWRTAPLWGIGYTEKVLGKAGRAGYLHDGRARTLVEAIMWHGGEAERSRQRFENLSQADRDALLAFLKSL